MTKAVWNGTTVAESDKTITIEGNKYFPSDSVKKEFFKESDTHTICPWKGKANYYSLEVNGQFNEDAAWYYPQPKAAAANIKNYIAFWHDVEVTD